MSVEGRNTHLPAAGAQVLPGGGIAIEQLRQVIRGRVIAPADEGYDRARALFYGGLDPRPAVIIRAADGQDVAQAISLARHSGFELAVRSGGHSIAGHSTAEGGIVLDLRDMRALEIDAEARTAWVETGLTAGEFTAAAAEHGLAVGFGDTGSVGVGGITLGGGVGFLVRKHGLTIDSLLAAEIVTADGQMLYVDAANHVDLFWAIRGGGGNFGVATRFKFRLHALESIVGGMLILPATAEVIAGFIGAAEAAPEELSTIANVMPAPPMPFLPPEYHGQMVVFAMLVYAGETETGEQALAPFRQLATPLADTLQTMRYPEMFPPEEEEYHPLAVGHTMFINNIDASIAAKILDYLNACEADMRVAQLRVLGGAAARVPVEATAYAHRQARIMVNLAAFYGSAEEKEQRMAWLRDFTAALDQGDASAYVNFLGDEGAERVQDAYPGMTWDRLREIKARYDPENLFRHNQNIPPQQNGYSG